MEKNTENCLLKADYEYGRLELYSLDERTFFGYAVIDSKEGMIHVCDLWINEEFRGQSYGSLLIKYVIEYAISSAVSCIFGYTAIDDTQVHRFYSKSGFNLCEDQTQDILWFLMPIGDSPEPLPDREYLAKICYFTNDINLN